MSARPIYAIAHRCNDINNVKQAIAEGANAIECDLQYHESKKIFVVNHDNDWDPQGDALIPYLDGLKNVLMNKPQVALVIFDCKEQPANQIITLINLVRAHLTDHVQVNVLFSVGDYDARSFFLPLKNFPLKPYEGVAIDQDNNSKLVSEFFNGLGITQHCYGNGIFAYGIGPNVPSTIMSAVARRAHFNQIKLVYVWTLQDSIAMRNYLRMGVDGVMVNNPATLHKVIMEDEFAGKLRLATRNDRPFVAAPQPAYLLTVKTGDVGSGGTDALLRFAVVGPEGDLLKYRLDTGAPGLFETDDYNAVTIFGDVGVPKKLRVWRDDRGNAPGWYLDSIRVTKTKGTTPAVDTKTVNFDQWIPEDEVVEKPVK